MTANDSKQAVTHNLWGCFYHFFFTMPGKTACEQCTRYILFSVRRVGGAVCERFIDELSKGLTDRFLVYNQCDVSYHVI